MKFKKGDILQELNDEGDLYQVVRIESVSDNSYYYRILWIEDELCECCGNGESYDIETAHKAFSGYPFKSLPSFGFKYGDIDEETC